MSTSKSEGEHRAAVILAVLAGQQSASQAADALGLSEQRIYQLCDKAQAALAAACEPGSPGRPTKGPPHPDSVRVKELEARNAQLAMVLETQRLREELALIVPHVLEPQSKPKLVAAPRPKKGGRRRQRKAGRGGR